MNKQLALFLLKMCYLTYEQFHHDGIFSVPKGFKLVKKFKAKALNEEEWFGFILESEDSIVIAFRGTQSSVDWIADATVFQRPFPYIKGSGFVHDGFLSIYKSCRDEIFNTYKTLSPQKRLYITGHSLGGALATLHAFDAAANAPFQTMIMYNYGSPRVGDYRFATHYHVKVPMSLRFVNIHDVVPMVPPPVLTCPVTHREWYYTHVKAPVNFAIQTETIEGNHSLKTYKKGIQNLM